MKQFNTWERYFDVNHPKHRYQVVRHNWIMSRVQGPRLLDVGCSGGLALFLAGEKSDISELYGVDVCVDIIATARERMSRYVQKKVCINFGFAESLNLESEYFDCVICGETLEHVKSDSRAMSEMFRVARAGAVLLVTVPKDGHLSTEHIRLYNKKSINDLISSAGFDIVEESEMPASVSGKYLLRKAIKR